MKLFNKLLLCGLGVAALTLTSCNDWLDVNTDPDNPSDQIVSYDQRLAHLEFYSNSAHQFADWRTNFITGDWTRYYNGGTYWHMSYWNPQTGAVTTSYQWFFVGAYANIVDMYNKAMAAGDKKFAGIARLMKAYGFMLMTDLHGEMPYTEAGGIEALPHYDTGRTIFMGCINDIEEAITLLEEGRSQTGSEYANLASVDFWNQGNVDKWIKLAYFLKARWLLKLTKKGAGSYKDGKYDANEILACLDKAMQSNADNTIINHTDDNGATHDVLGWDEPVDYSPLYSVCGMNAGYMVTKMLYDNLTNFGGYGVEDPRADHIIPWAYSEKGENTPSEIKWIGNWRRSLGVDMASGINQAGGPLRAAYTTTAVEKGGEGNKKTFLHWYINDNNPDRWGDTVYVECTSESKGYAGKKDLLYRRGGADVEGSKESGTFYTRVSSPTYVGTYAECCLIRAEVLYNQGQKAAAFEAYKKGIQASIEQMNEKLKVWVAEDPSLADCPSFTPIEQSAIDNFLNNGIGNAGNITLGHILTQKRIALNFSVEIWNDMRRYDFDPDLFFGWHIPAYHAFVANATKCIPEGKQFRRWRQCSHEYNYNAANLQAIGAQVPGAVMTKDGKENRWNEDDEVWTIPVWWDSDQE